MAASRGLIACGDLSGDDFVYWETRVRHASPGCLAWIGREGDLSEGGCAWRGLEFAILRMAASHGSVAGATFPRVASPVEDSSSPCFAWLPRMDSNHDTQIQNLQCYRYTTRH